MLLAILKWRGPWPDISRGRQISRSHRRSKINTQSKAGITAELAYTYQLDGKLKESADLYAQAADKLLKDLGLQLSAAQAQVGANPLEPAKSDFKRAEQIDGNSYRMHAIRGEIDRMHKASEAVNEYKNALANLPAVPAEGPLYGIQLHMDLADLYRAQRDDAAAHHEVEIAQEQIGKITDQGGKAPFLRLRAQIKLASGDFNGALADVKAALGIDANDPNGLQLNGDVLMKLGRTEEAITTYKRILEIDSKNRFALASLGYASRAAGRLRR